MVPLISVIGLLLLLWTLYGFFSSRVEQAQYKVVQKSQGYVVRMYNARIVAETTVTGAYEDALREGFRIVAGYIFGGNISGEKVSMTAPVMQESVASSEKIAMTTPVMVGTEGETHVISFGMPASYTLSTLPIPANPKVRLREVPPQKLAVIRFSWWRSKKRIDSVTKKLSDMLLRDGVESIGSPYYAGYNAPLTPPWMTRNEVLQEIK